MYKNSSRSYNRCRIPVFLTGSAANSDGAFPYSSPLRQHIAPARRSAPRESSSPSQNTPSRRLVCGARFNEAQMMLATDWRAETDAVLRPAQERLQSVLVWFNELAAGNDGGWRYPRDRVADAAKLIAALNLFSSLLWQRRRAA